MRVVVYIIILSLFLHSKQGHAQKYDSINKIFIRVYNLNGKKIGAGRIAFINDSAIGLKRSKIGQSFFVRNIGKIRTKKSGGNNVLMGALIGTGVGVAYVIVEDEDNLWYNSRSESILGYGVSGAFYGAAVGGITAAFKNSETFIINGDLKRWEMFKELVVY